MSIALCAARVTKGVVMCKSRFAVLLLAGLAGCASGPTYENYVGNDAACIKGGAANLAKFFTEGEAHVMIKEVDGIPTKGGGPHCFPSGHRLLGISAHNNYRSVNEHVALDLEPGKLYQLRANLQGITFRFRLVDVTASPEDTVAEFSLKVNATTQPTFVPIMVPAK
jgi:hypothetical protein